MLQRIQSLFLLASLLLVGALLFVPFAEILGADGNLYLFDKLGIYEAEVADVAVVFDGWPILMLIVICSLLFIATIFLYKKRILQMRLCTIGILLLLGLSGMIYYFTWHGAKILGGDFSFTSALVFPLIAMILTYLAIRNIAKDEALVRSVDRIR